MTNLFQKPWLVAVMAVVIIAIGAVVGSSALAFKTNVLTEVLQPLLAGLIAIAAITERATAVINDIWFGPPRIKAEDEVRLVNRKVNETAANVANARIAATEAARAGNAEFFTATAAVLSQNPVANHEAEIKSADQALAEVTANETRARLSLSFVISLIVSAVGVRSLAAMFELTSLPDNQSKVFHVVDIVLTAGVLTGGTAGISAISELLSTYVTATRKRALENP